MKPWAKATVQGGTCGLMLGIVLLIGGRLWQPQVAAAQAKQPAVPNVVKARRFEVVDAAGETRAILASLEDRTGLVLLDAAGKPGLILNQSKTDSFLTIHAGGPEAIVTLGWILTKSSRGEAVSEGGALILRHKDGKVIWKAP